MCDIYRAVYMCGIYRGKEHVRSTELRRISRRTWQDCIGCVTMWQDCIWPVTHKTHSIGCVTSTELRRIWNVWLSQSQDSCNKTLLDVWHLQSQDSFRKKSVFGLLPTSFFFFSFDKSQDSCKKTVLDVWHDNFLIWTVWLWQSQDSCNKILLDVWYQQSQDPYEMCDFSKVKTHVTRLY